jgi:hypothetical protein
MAAAADNRCDCSATCSYHDGYSETAVLFARTLVPWQTLRFHPRVLFRYNEPRRMFLLAPFLLQN